MKFLKKFSKVPFGEKLAFIYFRFCFFWNWSMMLGIYYITILISNSITGCEFTLFENSGYIISFTLLLELYHMKSGIREDRNRLLKDFYKKYDL